MKKIIVSLILIVASIAASLWFFPQLPDEIATNSKYNPVTTSKAIVAWIMPIVMIVVYLVMILVRNVTKKNATHARVEGPLLGILNATLLVLLVVHILILMYGMDYNINEVIIGPLVTGIVFLATGNYLPQISDNAAARKGNIVTFSSNEQAWRKTRTFMSRAFVIGGIIILLGALVPSAALLPVFITLLLATILIVSGGFFFYYVKRA